MEEKLDQVLEENRTIQVQNEALNDKLDAILELVGDVPSIKVTITNIEASEGCSL